MHALFNIDIYTYNYYNTYVCNPNVGMLLQLHLCDTRAKLNNISTLDIYHILYIYIYEGLILYISMIYTIINKLLYTKIKLTLQ